MFYEIFYGFCKILDKFEKILNKLDESLPKKYVKNLKVLCVWLS